MTKLFSLVLIGFLAPMLFDQAVGLNGVPGAGSGNALTTANIKCFERGWTRRRENGGHPCCGLRHTAIRRSEPIDQSNQRRTLGVTNLNKVFQVAGFLQVHDE
jgi:hypothetical protein